MKTKELIDILKDQLSTLEYYTPYLQTIPGVQEPDCTKLFQSRLDLVSAIESLEQSK